MDDNGDGVISSEELFNSIFNLILAFKYCTDLSDEEAKI